MITRYSLYAAPAIAGLLAGCADARPETAATVADSVGIAIVTNRDVSLPEWYIDTVPLVDIGSAEGEAGHDLALPSSSIRLRDGGVALSNGRINDMRLYSPSGDFIRAVGRSGEGPGEFQYISRLRQVRGDSIVVSDAVQPRLTYFTASGSLARTTPVEFIEGRPPRLNDVIDGTIGVWRVPIRIRKAEAARDSMVVVLRPLDGGDATFLARLPAAERYDQVLTGGSIASWNQPFSRNAYIAAANDIVWLGISDTYEVRAHNARGELTTIVRLDRPPAPVRGADRERLFEYQLDGAESDQQRAMYRDVHRVIVMPSTMPSYSALAGDVEGNVWVKEYRVPWESGPATWRVFGRDGHGIATIDLPESLIVHEIGADYVLGMWVDETDVEHVRMYSLHRSVR